MQHRVRRGQLARGPAGGDPILAEAAIVGFLAGDNADELTHVPPLRWGAVGENVKDNRSRRLLGTRKPTVPIVDP
jgi:hypothetical protein